MKSIKSKIISVGKNELSSEDLYKIKKKLLALNPEEDINKILGKIPNKPIDLQAKGSIEQKETISPSQTNLIYFDRDLKYTKEQSINDFANLISTKTDSEIRQILPKELNEYQKRVQLIVDKSDQQYNTYLQQLTSSQEKNVDLSSQFSKMKNEEAKLMAQLNESEHSIRKLNLKFELFSKLKPLFEILIRDFETDSPDEEKRKNIPKTIIQDIKLRRMEEITCANELEKQNEKIKNLQEEIKHLNFESRQNIEELSKKLSQVEKENVEKIEKYQNKISDLKYELSSNSDYKNQNIKLHNMLIQIFNLLFPKLNLERDLVINHHDLELETSDYKPRTYDEEEVIRYITLMIKNAKESTSGVLLREAVAYSNMMLRNVIKDKVNQNYNPFFVFKEIEKLIKEKEKEKENLNKIIKKYQEEAEKDTATISELEKEIQKQDHQYQIVLNKVDNMFKERIETAKNEKTNFILSKTGESKFHQKKTSTSTSTDRKETKHHHVPQLSLSTSNFSVSTDENIQLRKKGVKFNHHNIIENKKIVIPFLEEDTSQRAHYQYQNNYFSKNKFYKYQTKPPAETDGIRSLVEHANRLFLYKTKCQGKRPILSAVDRLNSKVNKLEKIKKRKLCPSTGEEMANKLIDKLDNMITGINRSDNS